jgi:transposase
MSSDCADHRGVCPEAPGSDSRLKESGTKAGNKRLCTELVELSWRLLLYQPDYYLVKKWQAILLNPKAHRRARKRAIIAFARQLLIDLWRWKTGRRTPEQLGWIMTEA